MSLKKQRETISCYIIWSDSIWSIVGSEKKNADKQTSVLISFWILKTNKNGKKTKKKDGEENEKTMSKKKEIKYWLYPKQKCGQGVPQCSIWNKLLSLKMPVFHLSSTILELCTIPALIWVFFFFRKSKSFEYLKG